MGCSGSSSGVLHVLAGGEVEMDNYHRTIARRNQCRAVWPPITYCVECGREVVGDEIKSVILTRNGDDYCLECVRKGGGGAASLF